VKFVKWFRNHMETSFMISFKIRYVFTYQSTWRILILWLLSSTIVENGNDRCAERQTWRYIKYDTACKRHLNWLHHHHYHHHQTTTTNERVGSSKTASNWRFALCILVSQPSALDFLRIISQTSAFFLNYTTAASFQILSISSHILRRWGTESAVI
jgi:hypothetical protein